MSVSNEPIVWLPFSGGGMLAALFVPVHLVVLGLVLPLGLADPGAASFSALAASWPARLYLLAFVGGCLLHAAHRLRYLLVELGLKPLAGPIAVLCYAAAILGIVWTCLVVF